MLDTFTQFVDDKILPLLPKKYQMPVAIALVLAFIWFLTVSIFAFVFWDASYFTGWLSRAIGALFIVWFILVDKK